MLTTICASKLCSEYTIALRIVYGADETPNVRGWQRGLNGAKIRRFLLEKYFFLFVISILIEWENKSIFLTFKIISVGKIILIV